MQIYFIFSRCFGWFHPNELTRISCELPRQLGDDEATEGGIELLFGLRRGVRVDAEELRIRTRETFISQFDVLVVLFLPKGETLGIVHLRFAEFDSLAERITLRLLLSCHFLRITMQRIIANHRLTIPMGSIKLAAARQAAAQFVQQYV